jgi:arylsulfatase A-like enzyme
MRSPAPGVCLLAVLFTSSASTSFGDNAETPPNVVFILADDLGYTDLSCYGSRYYESPHIDRMAAEGMRFTDGYTCGPNCAPTRAALMSGQYGPRTGVYTVGGIERFNWQSRPLRPVENVTQLPLEKITIAQALKSAGYATGMFGKWHLGRGEYHPGQRGFDEAIESSGRHFDFKTDPRTDYPAGTYLADFLTEQAIDFIRRHRRQPFFLYLPHFGVHSPYQAKDELIAKFQDKPAAGGHHDPTYAAMIASVDESVGRVLATLDELELDENTLVIFSSDNGGVGGYARDGIAGRDTTDNTPLRRGKGSLYEGGIRVPWIFRWPGRIAAGTTCEIPILSIDLYPTLLDVAGAQRPAGHAAEGNAISLARVLTGKQSHVDRDAIYWHFPGYLGSGRNTWRTTPVGVIRAGDWKLMEFFEDGRLELYNLREDIGEQRNLAAETPEKAKQLQERLARWRAEVKAPMPTPNEPVDPGPDERSRRRRAGRARP